MRILALADGSSSHSSRYVAELAAQGHAVTLASLQDGPAVDFLFRRSPFGEFASYVTLAKQINKLIESVTPEVINSHFASAYGFAAARCRSAGGNKNLLWALTVWGSDILISPHKSFLHKRRIEIALDGADCILADSSYLKLQTEALTKTPVAVFPWGIEQSLIADDETIHKKAEWKTGSPLKLIAPRPHNSLYRNEIILEALSETNQISDFTLAVSSVGPELNKFRSHAQELGLADRITYYDSLTREEFIKTLGESDIYLSASVSDSSPVSMIEAMALGVIPVAADHPGLSDFIDKDIIDKNSSPALLFDSENPQSLAGVLVGLRNLTTAERENLLVTLREKVRAVGIYEENIASTVALFHSLLK